MRIGRVLIKQVPPRDAWQPAKMLSRCCLGIVTQEAGNAMAGRLRID